VSRSEPTAFVSSVGADPVASADEQVARLEAKAREHLARAQALFEKAARLRAGGPLGVGHAAGDEGDNTSGEKAVGDGPQAEIRPSAVPLEKKLAARVGERLRVPPSPAHPPDGLLNRDQAAALLGVSASTFRDVVRPALATVKIGRRGVRFDRKEIQLWQAQHTVDGPSDSLTTAARSTPFASATRGDASRAQRVAQTRKWLLSRPRKSTPTPSREDE
jgi:predicted DNA-binding transcriptional regulator AlpA